MTRPRLERKPQPPLVAKEISTSLAPSLTTTRAYQSQLFPEVASKKTRSVMTTHDVVEQNRKPRPRHDENKMAGNAMTIIASRFRREGNPDAKSRRRYISSGMLSRLQRCNAAYCNHLNFISMPNIDCGVYGRAIFANYVSRCFVGRNDQQTLCCKRGLDGDLNVGSTMEKSVAYMSIWIPGIISQLQYEVGLRERPCG